jgi:hypothetical protein
MRHTCIVTCDLASLTIFFHIISFSGEKKVIEHVLIFVATFSPRNISHRSRIQQDITRVRTVGLLHVKCPLLFSDVIKPEFSRQIFEKYSDVKFHENPSSWSRVFFVRTDGRTDDEADSRFSQFWGNA